MNNLQDGLLLIQNQSTLYYNPVMKEIYKESDDFLNINIFQLVDQEMMQKHFNNSRDKSSNHTDECKFKCIRCCNCKNIHSLLIPFYVIKDI